MMGLFLVFVLSLSLTHSAEDLLLEELLKRNGDAYLLISDNAVGDLYMFDRSENYQRSDVIPVSSPLYSRLPNYVGFSVDKFGHIKLFRAKQDIDSPSGATSILDSALLARRHPREASALPSPMTGANDMKLPGDTSVQSIPAGWRYVISAEGEEGYMQVYESTGGSDSMGETVNNSMGGTSGNYKLRPKPGALKPGDVVLPPMYKTYPRAFYLGYHNGFWQGGRESYAVEHADAAAFTSFSTDFNCCGGTSYTPDPIADWGCYQIPYNDATKKDWVLYDRGPGNAGSFPLSPPIGAFFMLPHCMGGDYTQYGELRAAAMVRDVRKNVKVLLVDSFLSSFDNDVMLNTPSSTFDTLQDGRDFFSSAGPDGYSDGTDNPLASTVSYASDIGRWNNCGDLCGKGDIPSTQDPPPSPSSTAYASSYGKDQSQQKLYMIKVASLGGGTIQTSVVQIRVTDVGNQQDELVTPGKEPGPAVKKYQLGDKDADFQSNVGQQVVYEAFGADLGYSGSLQLPDHVQSLGFSKRRDGQTDYVYYSNLPSSHFTVSSNFWGTGGTLWFAEESSSNLTLRYQNFNHSDSNALSQGSIDAEDRLPLKAIAADGDNNVYIVHSKDTLEGPESMDRLFGASVNRNSLKGVCQSGVMESMLAPDGSAMSCTDLDSGVPVAMLNGVPDLPVKIAVTMKQHAGFVVEKLSPVQGSQPEKLGVIPSVQLGTCDTVFNFPPDFAGDNTFNADQNATSHSGWNCTISPAGFAAPDLSDINVKLGVINVPNPPASGSDTVLDIVDPCDTTPASASCDGASNLIEDTTARFRMENPPHYAGLPAVLSQSSDPILKKLGDNSGGDVKMISNYLSTGWDYTKTLSLNTGVGNIEDLYWDADTLQGRTLATLLNESFIPEASTVMSDKRGTGQPADRTMRYRWIVRALSPPHSLVDYTVNDMPYSPGFSDFTAPTPRVATGCENIRADGSLEWPKLEAPSGTQRRGLMFDSCWQDMDRVIAGPPETPVYAPENLQYEFLDPGEYQVTLMVGALGFDLTDITYLSDPASVGSTMLVTYHSMKVVVGAQAPGAHPYLRDVEVSGVNLNSDVSLDLKPLYSGLADKNAAFADQMQQGMASGSHGSLPVFPVQYEKDEDLVLTHENQLTPMQTEAQIQFFRSEDINYLQGVTAQQSKMDGAGVWDFEFSCPASSFNTAAGVYTDPLTNHCGIIDGVPLVDKRSLHPSNYGTGVELSETYGNDAAADISTRQSSRAIAGDLTVIESADFQVVHQGTVSQDSAFPAGTNLLDSPYAFYTWYDYKYVWFARYRDPNGDVQEAVLRTGNLAEVWLLNYLAAAGNTEFESLINTLAPASLNVSSEAPGSGRLMRMLDTAEREISLRIPLMQNNALLDGTLLEEMNGVLNADLNTDAEFASANLDQLSARIRPLKFPIPTGPTVIEIGCQIFGPAVSWKGQEEVLNSAGVPTGEYTYYDVAPAIVEADGTLSILKKDFFKQKSLIHFGDDEVSVWQGFGTPRNTYAPNPVLDFGLNLAADLPGFTINSSGQASYAANNDHFVEVFVSDVRNPGIFSVSNMDQSLVAGRANPTDGRLVLRDNNPYAGWLNSDGSDVQPSLPMLTQVHYETGPDPRNARRLGLLEGQSYGFGSSHRVVDAGDVDSSAPMNQSAWISMLWPSKPSPGVNLQVVGSHFHYYGSGNGAERVNDRFFRNDSWPSQAVSGFDPASPADWWINREISEESLFLYPEAVDVYPLSSNRGETSVSRPSFVHVLSAHLPDVEPNLFGFPQEGDESRVHIQRSAQSQSLTCMEALDGLPHQADPNDCYLETEWTLPASSMVAPWFYNRNDGRTWQIHAVGQDARLMDDYPGLGGSFGLDGFHYRLAGKTNSNGRLATVQGSDLSSMAEAAWAGLNQYDANPVGTLSWEDRSSPALKVSLTDFKSRQPVHYALVPDTGLTRDGGTGLLSHTERWHILRSADPRSGVDPLGNWFQASSIEKLSEGIPALGGAGPQSVNITPAEFAADTTVAEQYYEVPEDTRFEVKAVMTDNLTGQELEGELRIESANCFPASMDPSTTGLSMTLSPFDDTGMTAVRQYQDTGELRAWHYYPRNGFYDSLKITARDKVGNETAMCIPLRVIPQSVHFRKIGSEQEQR